ncbi:restriction endonuclease subunit S [Vibrio parahaemolyticus]|nr:restriction endonuclease subunit S [Vibrio parahaemolyticus]EJB8452206.1 restriction endonuclease subunit S [Vibrio parahaemolyticus]
MAVENLITEHIDIWTSAVKTKSTYGRGSSKKLELYGVKKLRELILELAVRGKLVPQDPNDEPASVLLECIAEEKDNLIKEKKIRKPIKTEQIGSDEVPFELPVGWEWRRLVHLVTVLGDGLHGTPEYSENGEYFFVNGNNLSNGSIQIKPETKRVSEEQYLKHKKDLNDRTVLVSINGTLGNVGFYNNEAVMLGKSACYFNLFKDISKDYIKRLIESPYFRNYAFAVATGSTIKNLGLKAMNNFVLAVPPKAEQHRIAAKVDELMALCDQLEQQTEDSIEAHQVLVTTLLDTLTNSADADELMQNWAQISEHFDTLFTTEESIDQLKQTILQLAVMGALSQPLNSDTPIDVHLDNILEQQKQLATAKEYSLIEAEVLKAKNEISNNRVVLKARCFCNFITKGTTPSKNELLETGDVPFLKVYNIVNNELDFDYRPIFISNEVHTSKLKRSIAHPGDVIMNIVGPPLGKVAVLSEQYPQWNMNQALAVFKPVSSVFNRYLYYVLSCELTLRSVLSEVKGTAGQDNLSLEQCRDLLVPIMSIQEQQRLVCLVDSLWDYCDRLKKRMKSSQKTQLHLTDAVTGQAV